MAILGGPMTHGTLPSLPGHGALDAPSGVLGIIHALLGGNAGSGLVAHSAPALPVQIPNPGIHYFGPGGAGSVPNPNFTGGHGVIPVAGGGPVTSVSPPQHGSLAAFLAAPHHSPLPQAPGANLTPAVGINPGGPMLPAGAPGTGHVDTGYNPAQYQLSQGNTAQAATDWEAHHPYAMSHGNVPDWVRQALAAAIAHHLAGQAVAAANPALANPGAQPGGVAQGSVPIQPATVL